MLFSSEVFGGFVVLLPVLSTADVLASPLHDLTKRLIAGHFGEALTADAWRKDR